MKKLFCAVALVSAGLIAGCGEPDPTTQPGFVKETASDPNAVLKQMGSGATPGTANPTEGGGAAPAGTDAAKP